MEVRGSGRPSQTTIQFREQGLEGLEMVLPALQNPLMDQTIIPGQEKPSKAERQQRLRSGLEPLGTGNGSQSHPEDTALRARGHEDPGPGHSGRGIRQRIRISRPPGTELEQSQLPRLSSRHIPLEGQGGPLRPQEAASQGQQTRQGPAFWQNPVSGILGPQGTKDLTPGSILPFRLQALPTLHQIGTKHLVGQQLCGALLVLAVGQHGPDQGPPPNPKGPGVPFHRHLPRQDLGRKGSCPAPGHGRPK